MLSRRTVLTTATGAATAAFIHGASWAAASKGAESPDVAIDIRNLSQEMKDLLGVRMPTLDAESDEDFVTAGKTMMGRLRARPEFTAHTEAFLRSKGFSTLDDTDMSYEECFNLLMQDSVYAARTRMGTTFQHIMWDRAARAFHARGDKVLTAMERTDKSGPGSLSLNPNLVIPASCRHEIHAQKGGYVGDPFAGWVYHYALTKGFFAGSSNYDELYLEVAQGHGKPADGVMRRALDLGCGTGQSTTALKMRFPKTEVWGIDVGAPMVRYAHHRAVNMGMEIHFSQMLAESLKFPDQHFDMVTDAIMFHEVDQRTVKKILAEAYRVLRPGGVFAHSDIGTVGQPKAPVARTILAKASSYSNYRFNVEPYWIDHMDFDFPQAMRDAGFKLDLTRDPIQGRARITGTKPA